MGASLRTVAASDAKGAVEALEEDGAVVIRDVASPETVAAIRADLTPHFDSTPCGFEEYAGLQTRRIALLIRRSAAFRDVIVHPTMLEIGAHFLGGAGNFQLHNTEGVDIGPGNAHQPLHTDDAAHFPWPARPRPEYMMVFLLAIDPFLVENGGTRVILGSHRWPEGRKPRADDEVVRATMPAGAVLAMLASVWHSGGANETDQHRVGTIFRFSRGWLRQGENQYLVAPPEIAREWNETLRALVGYRVVNGLGDVWSPEFSGLIVQDPIPDFILEALKKQGIVPGS